MKRLRAVIHGACLFGLTVGSIPVLGGCGSEDSTSGVIKPDEAKAKAEQQQTAEAFKNFQKTHKTKRR